jgi:hypothetical protein
MNVISRMRACVYRAIMNTYIYIYRVRAHVYNDVHDIIVCIGIRAVYVLRSSCPPNDAKHIIFLHITLSAESRICVHRLGLIRI